jgi:hypothetical protein
MADTAQESAHTTSPEMGKEAKAADDTSKQNEFTYVFKPMLGLLTERS